jgi:5-(aminomethyl)-3-furanmethanol phosphate kinase
MPRVDTVVKLGGGVLADAERFASSLDLIAVAARGRRLLVVPGGGPFADAVREWDRRLRLSDVAAHWMAVLAMDQYAHVVVDRLARAVLVFDRSAIAEALDAGRVPVLAPSRWLRDADPLPHSWNVTSDSIAAWVAGEVGARRLVLIKPPGSGGRARHDPTIVDVHFPQAISDRVAVEIVAADRIDALRAALEA